MADKEKGNAKQLVSLWQTKNDNMVAGEMELEKLETLVKAAKVAGKKAVKFLAFKNTSPSGKKLLNILAEPCDPYVGKDGKAKQKTESW